MQGEAPPAPLFGTFKEVMLSEHVAPSDVAFYFVHWLTDLAGAEPSPLGGAEKFVLKFPHAVGPPSRPPPPHTPPAFGVCGRRLL